MVRLQRVTFLALNRFLGLGHELLNQAMQSVQSLYVRTIQKPSLSGDLLVNKLRHNVNKVRDVPVVPSL